MKIQKQYHLFLAAASITLNLFFFVVVSSSDLSQLETESGSGGGLRGLKSFKEKASNATFDCSPSGPCVPCLYSEKKQDIYRCSETGYRIPIKCLKTLPKHHPNLLESSNGSLAYLTYRSCITAVDEDKLSLLGFEALMLILLLSSSLVIFRRKGTLILPLRLPANPRF